MRIIYLLLGLLLVSDVEAQTVHSSWQLLAPGQYHDKEAPTKPGGGWLALITSGGNWHLVPTPVHAELVNDGINDAEGQKTGVVISSNYSDALALVRFPGSKAGKVDTPNMKFKDNPRILSAANPIRIRFHGEEYAIEVINSVVSIRKGNLRTRLQYLNATSPEGGEDSASLLWAGDLDGDGKLDLLFSYTGYNSGGICMYLSAGAAHNELVTTPLCHGGVGC